MDQPGKVANPACGPLKDNKCSPPCLRWRLRNWSRETGSAVPSCVSPLILHTQAESDWLTVPTHQSSIINLVLTCGIPPAFRDGVIVHLFIRSTTIGSVPSLSGHAIAYRWRPLPVDRRRRASSLQGNSSNGCCLVRYHHGPFFVRLAFPTPFKPY